MGIKMQSFNKQNQFFIFSFIVLISIIKITIVSGNEIIAMPYDPYQYVEFAKILYWRGHNLPFRPAGYPLWIALVYITGIPLRIATEFLLLFSCSFFVIVLRSFKVGPVVCCMVFFSMIFHPFSLVCFDYTYNENLYAPMLILALSFIFISLKSKTRKDSILFSLLSGICFAIIWHTREENILILYALMLILISKVTICFYNKIGITDCFKRCLVLISPIATVLIIINLAVYSINYYKYDYWGQGSPQPKWVKSALIALTKIKPSKPIRRIAVTKEARKIAYQVSPTFNELKPYLESMAAGEEKEGEFDSAGFIWALRTAVSKVKRAGYSKKIRDIYLDIASEIEDAIEKKIIPSRIILFNPLINPAYEAWLMNLPESFIRVYKLLLIGYKPSIDNHLVVPQNIVDMFDDVTNRRAFLLKKGPMYGRVFVAGHKINKIELCPVLDNKWFRKSYIISSTNDFHLQGELVKGQSNFIASMYKFRLPDVHGRFDLTELSLIIYLKDGLEIVINSPKKGKVFTYTDKKAKLKCYYAIDSFPLRLSNFHKIMYKIQNIMGNMYGKVLFWLSVVGSPLAFAVILWFRKSDFYSFFFYLIIGNLFLIVLGNVFFYAVVDASAWEVPSRYLFPSMLLYSSVVVLLIGNAVKVLNDAIRKSGITDR